MTPEPRFSGLVLDHQGLEELGHKNSFVSLKIGEKLTKFSLSFFIVLLAPAPSNLDGRAPNH